MGRKASKADMLRRNQRIQALMAQGANKGTILATVAKEENIADCTVERQYLNIIGEIQKLVSDNKPEFRAMLMARQESIYQKALERNQLKLALEATVYLAKLAGLFEQAVETPKRPDAILFKERDFSNPLTVVPDKTGND
jgi:hypothetical protein